MYDLEIEKAIQEINKRKSKQVLIQLADGLKNKADEVVDSIEKKTKAKVFIWLGSCFGACDIPLGLNILDIDLVIQWGHNRFIKEGW